jgi:hypothetical protein
MTVTCRLWGFVAGVSVWCPLGPGADDTITGTVNDGFTMDEDESDSLRLVQPIDLLSSFDRLYLEVVAIGGTATAVKAYISVANDRYRNNQ